MGTTRIGNRIVHGPPSAKAAKIVGLVILGILAVAALAIIFGLLVMWLWNALMPDIFGLPEVGYWQAVGLVVLGHILFGAGHREFVHKGGKNKPERGVRISRNGTEYHWSSFRAFWDDCGRDAFDSWLNGKGGEPEAEEGSQY